MPELDKDPLLDNNGDVQQGHELAALPPNSDSPSPAATPSHARIIFDGIKIAAGFTYSLETIAIMQILLRSKNSDIRAAAALIVTLMNAVGAPTGMMPYGAMAEISRLLGELANDRSKQEQIYKQITAIERDAYKVVAIPAAIGTTLLATAPYYLPYMGQSPEVVKYTGEFAQPFAVALPFFAARMVYEQLLIAFGDNKIVLAAGLSSFSLGTLLAVLAHSGYLGEWLNGTRGIAMSYAATEIVTAVAFVLRRKFAERYPLQEPVQRSYVKQLLQSGGPIALSAFMEMFVAVVLTVLAGLLKGDAQENMSDALQVPVTLFVLVLAICTQYNQVVSNLIGHESYAATFHVLRQGLFVVMALAALLCVTPMIIPQRFLSLVGYTGHEQSQANTMLRISCGATIMDAGRNYLLTLLRTSLKDFNLPTILSASCLWMGVGLGASLAFLTELDGTGLMVGYMIGIAMALLTNLPRLLQLSKESRLQRLDERLGLWAACCNTGNSNRAGGGPVYHN